MYNNGMECRIYRPIAGTINAIGDSNTCMGNMLLSHTYPHKPKPGQAILKLTEDELDRVLNGYTKDSHIGNLRGASDNWNKGKQKVLEHAKQSTIARERPTRD